MWVHDLNPVLLNLGGLEIRYYGLVYVIGFILSIVWLMFYRREIDLKKDEVYDFVFYLMLGVIVGSRLFHVVFWEPNYYLLEPWKIFFLWEGGMAYHGGLVGVVVAAYWYCKNKKISFLKVADILTVPGILALGLGRLANFVNGELVGRVTEVAWCVDFGDESCRHPYVIYSALKRFAIGGFLWSLSSIKFKEGLIFWSGILLMGIGRFVLDFYREDILYWSFSVGQWMSLAMIIVSLFVLVKNYSKSMRKIFK